MGMNVYHLPEYSCAGTACLPHNNMKSQQHEEPAGDGMKKCMLLLFMKTVAFLRFISHFYGLTYDCRYCCCVWCFFFLHRRLYHHPHSDSFSLCLRCTICVCILFHFTGWQMMWRLNQITTENNKPKHRQTEQTHKNVTFGINKFLFIFSWSLFSFSITLNRIGSLKWEVAIQM